MTVPVTICPNCKGKSIITARLIAYDEYCCNDCNFKWKIIPQIPVSLYATGSGMITASGTFGTNDSYDWTPYPFCQMCGEPFKQTPGHRVCKKCTDLLKQEVEDLSRKEG